jgi:hypothetical protein
VGRKKKVIATEIKIPDYNKDIFPYYLHLVSNGIKCFKCHTLKKCQCYNIKIIGEFMDEHRECEKLSIL